MDVLKRIDKKLNCIVILKFKMLFNKTSINYLPFRQTKNFISKTK